MSLKLKLVARSAKILSLPIERKTRMRRKTKISSCLGPGPVTAYPTARCDGIQSTRHLTPTAFSTWKSTVLGLPSTSWAGWNACQPTRKLMASPSRRIASTTVTARWRSLPGIRSASLTVRWIHGPVRLAIWTLWSITLSGTLFTTSMPGSPRSMDPKLSIADRWPSTRNMATMRMTTADRSLAATSTTSGLSSTLGRQLS